MDVDVQLIGNEIKKCNRQIVSAEKGQGYDVIANDLETKNFHKEFLTQFLLEFLRKQN